MASRPERSSSRPHESASVAEVVEYVTTYAKQETLGPLKGAGRWLAFGTMAALSLALGLVLMLLGLLRLLQTEWSRSASGALSWLAYAIVLLVGVAVVVFTFSRISKTSLNSPDE